MTVSFRCRIPQSVRGPAFALLALALGIESSALASSYSLRGGLTAQSDGDGAPDQGFGTQVAVDGDLAVVASLATESRPAQLHTFERVDGVWTRRPDQVLDVYGTEPSISLDLRDGFMIVGSNRPTNHNVSIYRRLSDGWDQERSSFTNDPVASVAIDGRIAVAGYVGRLYANAYRRDNSTGSWTSQVLQPDDIPTDSGFGASVSIVAGAVAIGAPTEDVTGGNGVVRADAGAAYVFELTGDTWNQAARLVEPDQDLRAGNWFGAAVGISGADEATPDRLLVAAARPGTGGPGRMRGYTRSGGAWSPVMTILSPEPPGTQDGFGCALRLDGTWAVVGACESSAVGNARGAAWVLRFNTGFTSLTSATRRVDALADDFHSIGPSLAIDRVGPTVLIGNPRAEVYGNHDEGAVLVGRGISEGSIALPTRTLDLGQGLTSARAGLASFDGNTLAMSAFAESIGGQQSRGAVYVHRRSQQGFFSLEAKLLAPDGLLGDHFGRALALVGDSLVVGAPERSIQGLSSTGSIYAFRRSGAQWSLEAQLEPAVPTGGMQYGRGLTFDGSTAVICTLIGETDIYVRDTSGGWTRTQTLPHGCETPQLEGDRLILNDPIATVGNIDYVGRVSTYVRAGGTWQLQHTLFGSQADQRFGYQIASDGPLLAVASTSGGGPTRPPQLFRAAAASWLPEATLTPSDSTQQCFAVEMQGQRVFAGCPGAAGTEAVYLFEPINGVWTQTQRIANPQVGANSSFGSSLDAAPGGLLFVSALAADLDFEGQGAAYIYEAASEAVFGDGFEEE